MTDKSSFFIYDRQKNQISVYLKIKANSSNNKIEGTISYDDKVYLKVSIKAAPENGKANEAIIKFFSKEWKIAQKNLEIVSGSRSSYKLMQINNSDNDFLNKLNEIEF